MPTFQRGSILPIVCLVLIGVLVSFLGYRFLNLNSPVKPLVKTPQATVSPAKVYEDKDLAFRFEYPASGFELISDNEENYFKATATDHRKNFAGYVGYQPPEFIKGFMLKKSNTKVTPQYDSVPLILWVFNNPNKLSIDAWFNKYWYYPFIWGIFAQPGKGHIYPSQEATVSGRSAKSVIVSYQPGQPEFTYIASGDRMFMFRVIKKADEKIISRILSSFKFTQ